MEGLVDISKKRLIAQKMIIAVILDNSIAISYVNRHRAPIRSRASAEDNYELVGEGEGMRSY